MANTKVFDRVGMTVSGTPDTASFTLNAAATGYRSFAGAGVPNSGVVSYLAEEGSNWEFGTGTYTSSGTTLSRDTVTASSAGGTTKVSFTSAAIVYITAQSADLVTFDSAGTAVLGTNPTGRTPALVIGGYNSDGGVGYHGFLALANTYGSGTNPYKFFRLNATGAVEIVNSGYTTTIFSLTDAGVLNISSDMGVGVATDGSQWLHIAAGTTTKAPLEFNAGTVMTTVDAGSMEYDGTCFYAAPFGSSRSAIHLEQLVVLGTTYTLTSQTAAQKLFNATTNGAVTLAVGTYQFECAFSLTSMSNSSGSFGFALGVGTAVIGSQGWFAFANKAAAATASTAQMTYNTAANTTMVTAATGTVGQAFIKGFFRVTTAGTVVPQVSLGVAAAAVVGAQSYFKCSPVSPTNAAATNITVGNWS